MHNERDTFVFGVSENERESNAEDILSPTLYNFHKKANTFINIGLCLIVLWILDFQIFKGWNFAIIAGAFILFDMMITVIDNYFFHIKPYYQKKRLDDINKLQNYVSDLEKKYRKSKDKANDYLKNHCKGCDYRNWNDYRNIYYCGHSEQYKCSILKNADYWESRYKKYKAILDKRLEEIEEKQVIENTKVSSEYQNKIDYFKDLNKKYSHYMKNEKYSDLKVVVKSLEKLIALLEKKPIGLSFIPNTTYIYLDELQEVFNTLEGLDEEKQKRYSTMVNKISVALSENIEKINRRIDEYEVGDLEVSLNVLYQELVKEGEN